MSSLDLAAPADRSPPLEHPPRRYPVGAEVNAEGVSFRVWAPAVSRVFVVVTGGDDYEMVHEPDGYFSLQLDGMGAGTLYKLRLAGLDDLLPDPASRFQPQGPEGPSLVVDHREFEWHDHDWAGITPENQVLYEFHVGTFTQEGTWAAAAEKLPMLKEIGVTCLEVMPANEFAGTFGWGYDGFLPYAPTRLYGAPDDVRRFIDTAHALGIGVILDVVYNHFGNGDRYRDFSPDYFTEKYWNEWGSSIHFDGDNSAPVREFFAKNAAYWIDEFHFDGLRLDATQALYDDSDEHIMALIAREARAAAGKREIYLVAENEPQDTRLVRPAEKSGYGLDTLWNDDFHHSAMVTLTGRNEAYYHDHRGTAQEFVSAARYGYLFQGQRYDWQDAPRGQPAFDLGPQSFIHFLQNHDQIANSGTGVRMDKLASPARVRAMTALLLLGPQTPMLFQGQEFGASSPFFYFADQQGDMVDLVRNGRIEFLGQFPSLKDAEFGKRMPVPADRETFERSKLDWSEWDKNSHVVALHRELLTIRREHSALGGTGRIDGSVLSPSAFMLRFFSTEAADERLLLVNFGSDLAVTSLADPLIAAPYGTQWKAIWSSEDPLYGGAGRRPIDLQRHWTLPADSAVLFAAETAERRPQPDRDGMRSWQDTISGTGNQPRG